MMSRAIARLIGGLAAVTTVLIGARADLGSVARTAAPPTFAADIASILYSRCIACHRPGQAGPFPLISYEDARTHGRTIAEVTAKREMPPWHAARADGFLEFRDERRLTDRQIATIKQWVDAGMPAGDLKKAPRPPAFPTGWSLGIPDLVVQLPYPINVPADGPDLYRNVIVPLDLPDDRWIAAYDFEPTARRVMHHTILFVGPATATVDPTDVVPGAGAMMRSGARDVAWNLLGVWTPGRTGQNFPDGVGQALPRHSNLVIQIHLHPSGKEERADGRVALYFTRTPPRHSLVGIQVPPMFGFGAGIDIPAGDARFMIKDDFTLPVDVDVYGAMGHAHYLGREMKMTAVLPGGATRGLLWILRWDFAWQELYYYKTPFRLPKGTVIHTEIRYDNSAANPSNPHSPPADVHWGRESTDEMGTMALAIAAPDGASADTLRQAENRHLAEQLLRRVFRR